MRSRVFRLEIDPRENVEPRSFRRGDFRVLRKENHAVVRNGARFFGVEEGFGDFHAFFRIGDFHLSELFQAVTQGEAANVLDFQPRSGVDFEKLRTVGRDHPIEREVSEIGKELYFGGIQENRVPVGNLSFFERRVSLRESGCVIFPIDEAARNFPASDIQSEPYSALGEIGFSIGFVRRHAYHGGYGHQIEHDYADVSETMFAKSRKRVRRHERFLDEHGVGS